MRILILLVLLFPRLIISQEIMEANQEKLSSIDGTIDEMLRVVNGEKGKQRNWDAFKNLFLETCNFTVVYGETDSPFETANIEEMIQFMKDDYYNSGYNEKVINRRIEKYNGIAHVFEVVMHTEPNGNKVKGLNSYQLVEGNMRWYISNIIWTAESKDNNIPSTFMKN